VADVKVSLPLWPHPLFSHHNRRVRNLRAMRDKFASKLEKGAINV